MADLTCDLCEQERAGAMFTNLDNGDTMAIGQACMLTFTLTTAAELAEAAPASEKEQYAELGSRLLEVLPQLAPAPPEPPEAPKRKPGRPRKTLVVTDENPVTGDMQEYVLGDDATIGEATS